MEQKRLHPERFIARVLVRQALRDARLRKRPCCVCGERRVHAHHEDYDWPLDVVWLCQKHHMQRHKSIAEDGSLWADWLEAAAAGGS